LKKTCTRKVFGGGRLQENRVHKQLPWVREMGTVPTSSQVKKKKYDHDLKVGSEARGEVDGVPGEAALTRTNLMTPEKKKPGTQTAPSLPKGQGKKM